MARAATTSDVFNAIAEPRRRQIVDLLALVGEQDVTELVVSTGLSQPTVSKHLGVLRKVGVVVVQKAGQRRVYRLNPQELKPVHDWIQHFERFWDDHLSGIKEAAELAAKQTEARKPTPSIPSSHVTTSHPQPPAKEKDNGR